METTPKNQNHFFTMFNQEHIQYSSVFNGIDPDGNNQTDTEGFIAGYLFDEPLFNEPPKDDAGNVGFLLSKADSIIDLAARGFHIEQSEIHRHAFQAVEMWVSTYIKAWWLHITGENRTPHEEDCAQAGRDLLLVIIRFLRPEWVAIEESPQTYLREEKKMKEVALVPPRRDICTCEEPTCPGKKNLSLCLFQPGGVMGTEASKGVSALIEATGEVLCMLADQHETTYQEDELEDDPEYAAGKRKTVFRRLSAARAKAENNC